MRLRELFNGLLGLFQSKERTVIPLPFIRALFRLDDPRYKPAPGMTDAIHSCLGMGLSVRDVHNGKTRAFYSNPKKTLPLRPLPSAFSDEPVMEPFEIPASSAIMTHDHLLTRWKHSLAIVIRPAILTPQDEGIGFALYGTYDRQGNFTVERIYMPEIDAAGRLAMAKRMPAPTGEATLRALAFAQLCVEQVFNKHPLTLGQNLTIVNSLDLKGISPPWQQAPWTPAPPPPAP